MLRDLVGKELRATFSSSRFVVIFVASTVLIFLSLFSGIRSYSRSLGHYNAALSLTQDTLENQVSYEALGVWGDYKLFKPPSKLSAVVEGVEGQLGRSSSITIYDEPRLVDSRYNEEPIFAMFGTLDLLFIVKVGLSLFAILYVFDSISGEREGGTLKLILSNSVPRDTIILGKLVGNSFGLVLPLLIPFSLGAVVLLMHPALDFRGRDWLSLAMFGVLILLYLLTFLSLGIFVSSRNASSSNSLLIVLVCWVMFVLVVPRLSVMVAAWVSPVPSTAEVLAKKQALDAQSYREVEAALERWRQVNVDFSSSGGSASVPSDVAARIAEDARRRSALEKRRIDESFNRSQEQRLRLARWLSRLSPAAAFSNASMAIAQTDIPHQERFLLAVREYQRQFAEYIAGKRRDERRARALRAGSEGESDRLDVSDLPKLVFKERPMSESIASALPDAIVLACYSLLFFAGAFFSFLYYDVR